MVHRSAEAAGLDGDPATVLAQRVEQLLARCVPGGLATWEVGRGSVRELAEAAMGQWTARFNPRPLKTEDFEALFRRALAPR